MRNQKGRMKQEQMAHVFVLSVHIRHPLTTLWSPPPINRGRAPSGWLVVLCTLYSKNVLPLAKV